MKRIVLITLLIFTNWGLIAQTDGLSYQAVIMNPNTQEIPGADVSGNILPNTKVSIRFTILDANNAKEYQEVQITSTDQYGMVNLVIGKANHNAFTLISWDGSNKELKVEIDFKGGNNFVELSREQLHFLPYANHRNIKASGILKVDQATLLNGELTVQEPTHLNSTLSVNNNSTSNLTGDLKVGGATVVEGKTNLNSSLDVNNKAITNLSGDLNVGKNLVPDPSGEPFDEDATTKLNGALSVVGKSKFTTQENSGPAKFNVLDANVLIISEDVTKQPSVPASSTLNGDTKLLGTNLLEGSNDLKGTNLLTGVNTFGAPESTNTNTLNGDNILNGVNKIGTQDDHKTNIKGELSVNTTKQIKITSTLNGPDSNINSYPLLLEGGNQGIAIKVAGSANKNNDFISFRDSKGGLLGRIEGQTQADLDDDWRYQLQKVESAGKIAGGGVRLLIGLVEAAFSTAEVAAALSSSTVCAGLGVCVTAPPASLIVAKAAKTILKYAKAVRVGIKLTSTSAIIANYFLDTEKHLGVTFLSGNGDYAEYIPKEIISEDFIPGELVGIKNGLVTKDVWGAEKTMIISTQPIVLGNMPQANNEMNAEKIAFMGQVPVTIIGKAEPGDYILPNVLTSNFARAVHPKDMKTHDYKYVAGVVWNIIEENSGISIVNVAVGINTNDLTEVVYQQEEELKAIRTKVEQLQIQMEKSNAVRAKLVPGYAEAIGITTPLKSNQEQTKIITNKQEENKANVVDATVYGSDLLYFEMPNELIEQGIALARQVNIEASDDESAMNKIVSLYEEETLKASNLNSKKGIAKTAKNNFSEDPFWQKMDNNPAYKEEIIQLVKLNLDKAYHTHKKDINTFNGFKIRKD